MRIRVYLPKGETLLFEHVETLVAVGEPVTWQPGVLIYNPEHIIGMQVFADVPQAPEATAWKAKALVSA